MTELELQQANENVKILQRRKEYLRRELNSGKGFLKAEHEALLWVMDELLPLWIKLNKGKFNEHHSSEPRPPALFSPRHSSSNIAP